VPSRSDRKRKGAAKPAPRPRPRRRAAAPAAAPPAKAVAAPAPKARVAPLPPPVESVESVEAPLPALSNPEAAIAARVRPPEAERAFPTTHRAIFFDVEDTSRAQHIARVLDHLAIDRVGSQTEFFAVGNWRVIGHDTARLLARHGAHLIHSAPSVGVRDWSDLRIAVAAGVWLAAARPGDSIELVSDDRAFDAVGDVASSLGIVFRRLSYRGLAGAPVEDVPDREPEPARESSRAADASRRRRRGGGRYRGQRGGPPSQSAGRHAPAPRTAPAPRPTPAVDRPEREADDDVPVTTGEPHTAPHDEIVTVVSELMRAAPGRGVTIDTLANALKARGFRRPPGSPRLITRLRRIRDLSIDRTGQIRLVGNGDRPESGPEETPREEPREALAPPPPMDVVTAEEGEGDEPEIGNERQPEPREPGDADQEARTRRRSRRGGRRHRRRRDESGSGQPV
jgi:hypothetical protein